MNPLVAIVLKWKNDAFGQGDLSGLFVIEAK